MDVTLSVQTKECCFNLLMYSYLQIGVILFFFFFLCMRH